MTKSLVVELLQAIGGFTGNAHFARKKSELAIALANEPFG